jgi:hypothetical protein
MKHEVWEPLGKITKLFVFIVNQEGVEKIVTWPDKSGMNVPLVYLNEKEIEHDKMKLAIQTMANVQKLYFELREYALVEKSVERFYPSKKHYNA